MNLSVIVFDVAEKFLGGAFYVIARLEKCSQCV